MPTTVNLTSANDTYTSAAGDYDIYGMGGNDTVTTGAGNNLVVTGLGNSTITTGAGSSIVTTGDGNQTITTGAGPSTVTTGIGNSVITTGAGLSSITVGDGNNTITAGAGDATITTGNGNETITSGAGNDVIETGIGNTTITAAAGNDVLVYHVAGNQNTASTFDGGTGVDTLRLVLTRAEWMSDAIQTDVANYLAFQAAHTAAGGDADGVPFKFNSFGLSAQAIEKLQVQVDGVLIDPANHAFTVASDVITTTEKSSSVAIDVLANDSVPELVRSLTYTDPAHGSLQFAPAYTTSASAPSAKFVYTPTAGYYDHLAAGETATDSFDYTVTDATGAVKTATVAVVITGTNDVPVITSQPQTGVVLAGANPALPNMPAVGRVTYTDADLSDAHNLTINVAPAHGIASVDDTGAWSYTVGNDSAVNALPVGQHLTDSFSVLVDDLEGGKVSQLVTIDITRNNHAPVANQDSGISIYSNGAVPANNSPIVSTHGSRLTGDYAVLDVLANDTDTDPGDQAGLRVVRATSADGATVGISLTPGAGISYKPGHAFDYLAAGETAVDTVTYVIQDPHGALSNPTTASITVIGLNAAPVITSANLAGAVTEQVVPSGNLSTSGTIAFTDVNLSDTHTLNRITSDADAVGTLTATITSDTDHSSGAGGQITWTYNVADAAIASLAFGQTKVETFNFDLFDNHGGVVTNNVSVTITGTNQAPVITNPVSAAAGSVTEDAVLTATGQLTASDADTGATQSWSVLGPAVGTYGAMAVNATTGVWTYAFDNANHQALAAGEQHTETFNVRVTDDHGATADQQVSVLVNGANDAPVPILNPVAYYKFDNPANLGLDSSGHGNNLVTFGSGVSYTANGEYGGGLSLTGNGGLTTMANSLVPAGVPLGGQSYTISAWFQESGPQGALGIVGWGNYGAVNQVNALRLGTGDQQLWNYWWAHDVGTSAPQVYDQQFHNVAVTYDGATRDMYLDGQLVATDQASGLNVQNANFAIGRTVGNEYFTGVLDNVALFDSALSATQVQSLMMDSAATGTVTKLPMASGDSILTSTGAIGFNDVDAIDTHTIGAVTSQSGNLGQLTASVSTDTTHGTGGVVTWNYSVADSAVEYLQAGQTKVESFSFDVLDGHGGQLTQTITETIVGADEISMRMASVVQAPLLPMTVQLFEASNPHWDSLMNDSGVWILPNGGSDNQDTLPHLVVRQFDTTGGDADFTFKFSADDVGALSVDGIAIPNLQYVNFTTISAALVHLAAGTHTILFDVQNTGGPAGFALEIDDAAGHVVWNTHSHLEPQVLVGVDMNQLVAHALV